MRSNYYVCLQTDRLIPELEGNLTNQKHVYQILQSLRQTNFTLDGKRAVIMAGESPILFSPRILWINSEIYPINWYFSYIK